jgi:hypothetical protein
MTIYNRYILKTFFLEFVAWFILMYSIIFGITKMSSMNNEMLDTALLNKMFAISAFIETINVIDIIVVCVATSYFLRNRSNFNFAVLHSFGLPFMKSMQMIFMLLSIIFLFLVILIKPVVINFKNDISHKINSILDNQMSEILDAKLSKGVNINLYHKEGNLEYIISCNAILKNTEVHTKNGVIALSRRVDDKTIFTFVDGVVQNSNKWQLFNVKIFENNQFKTKEKHTIDINITKENIRQSIKNNIFHTEGMMNNIYDNIKVVIYSNLSQKSLPQNTKIAILNITNEITIFFKMIIFFTMSILFLINYERNFSTIKPIIKIFIIFILLNTFNQVALNLSNMTDILLYPFVILSYYAMLIATLLALHFAKEWNKL